MRNGNLDLDHAYDLATRMHPETLAEIRAAKKREQQPEQSTRPQRQKQSGGHRHSSDLRPLLRSLEMSQADLSRVAEVDAMTVSRWATGKRRVPGLVWAYLDLKAEVIELAKRVGRGRK